MNVTEVYGELFGRIRPLAEQAVKGLTAEQLAMTPSDGANTIGWLVWHLARVQDHHIAELLEADQIWTTDGWSARFQLAADPQDIGYGHTTAQVAGVLPDGPDACLSYLDAVVDRPIDDGLDRIVDRRWDPPVTLGVRLVSILGDSLQHLGQAAYARGQLGY
jgi:hypothetical protein